MTTTRFYQLHSGTLLLCLCMALFAAAARIHPIGGLLSVGFAVLSFLVYARWQELVQLLRSCLPTAAALLVFNLLFNRNGVTVLFYFGNVPVLFESLLYAVCAAFCFIGTMLWFSFYALFLDSDRVYRLLAGISGALGVVVSLSLAFVPKALEKYAEMQAERVEPQSRGQRFAGLVLRLSALFSWMLEDAFATAVSMKARGALCRCKWVRERKPICMADILCILASAGAAIALFAPPMRLTVYPKFMGEQYWTDGGWYLLLAFFYALPAIFRGWEMWKWRCLLQRI